MKHRRLTALALVLAGGCAALAEQNDASSRLARSPFAAIAGLAPKPQANAALDDTIMKLGSDDFATRDAATSSLTDPGSFTEADLIEARRTRTLSAEQAERIVEALRRRFFAAPRPALGVSMGVDQASGSIVLDPQPAFPAFGILKAGDMALEIDGVSLKADEDRVADQFSIQRTMRATILSHLQGETVALRILRDGETLDVTAPLGRYEDLNRGKPPIPGQAPAVQDDFETALPLAWGIRALRLGLADTEDDALRCAARAQSWAQYEHSPKNPGAGEGLMPGGYDAMAMASKGLAGLARAPEQMRGVRGADGMGAKAAQRDAMIQVNRAENQFFAGKRLEMRQQIETWRALQADPSTPAQTKADLAKKIEAGESNLRDLEQRMRLPGGR